MPTRHARQGHEEKAPPQEEEEPRPTIYIKSHAGEASATTQEAQEDPAQARHSKRRQRHHQQHQAHAHEQAEDEVDEKGPPAPSRADREGAVQQTRPAKRREQPRFHKRS